jgi:hypothetical protein
MNPKTQQTNQNQQNAMTPCWNKLISGLSYKNQIRLMAHMGMFLKDPCLPRHPDSPIVYLCGSVGKDVYLVFKQLCRNPTLGDVIKSVPKPPSDYYLPLCRRSDQLTVFEFPPNTDGDKEEDPNGEKGEFIVCTEGRELKRICTELYSAWEQLQSIEGNIHAWKRLQTKIQKFPKTPIIDNPFLSKYRQKLQSIGLKKVHTWQHIRSIYSI